MVQEVPHGVVELLVLELLLHFQEELTLFHTGGVGGETEGVEVFLVLGVLLGGTRVGREEGVVHHDVGGLLEESLHGQQLII